jgi:GTP-binding protein YchF
MKTGIVGLAMCGKTTLFNALTGSAAQTGPGGVRKANLGRIRVPDARVDRLAQVYQPKKTTYADIQFVDVPAATGDGGSLDAATREALRGVQSLVHVVRGFGDASPEKDLLAVEGELILNDLIQVEQRKDRIRKEGNKAKDGELMDALQAHLEANLALRTFAWTDAQRALSSGFQYLSDKPCMVLLNVDEGQASAPVPQTVAARVADLGMALLCLSASVECEIAELPPEDQPEFLAALGLEAPATTRFVQSTYRQLDLISFLTAGEDECRAWTIRRGTSARAAAGKIHSDIERGFIRAEVIAFADFTETPSEAQCRERGKLRLEGKEYAVQDGDIIHFRFNV